MSLKISCDSFLDQYSSPGQSLTPEALAHLAACPDCSALYKNLQELSSVGSAFADEDLSPVIRNIMAVTHPPVTGPAASDASTAIPGVSWFQLMLIPAIAAACLLLVALKVFFLGGATQPGHQIKKSEAVQTLPALGSAPIFLISPTGITPAPVPQTASSDPIPASVGGGRD
jgi:hypothetical protein